VADELRIGLSELLRKAMIEQDASFLKEGLRVLSEALMELEVQEHVGGAPHERSAESGWGSATDSGTEKLGDEGRDRRTEGAKG
jgi:transposase-like protein